MKNMDLQDQDFKILNMLLKKPRLTFQEIVNFEGFKRALNRNRARARLDILIEKQFIQEENRKQWKRGQKLWFTLTEKGKSVLLEKTLNNVKESLETVDMLVSGMLSEPEKLAEWKKSGQKAVREAAGPDRLALNQAAVKLEELFKEPKDNALKEKIQRVMKIRETHFGTFRQSLRKMHLIAVKLFAPPTENMAGNMYLLINENGVINMVKEDEILMHPNISVISG